MRPVTTVTKTSRSRSLQDRLKALSKQAVYVGIPTTTAQDRDAQLIKIASGSKNKKRRGRAATVFVANDINNAEALYLFSKGSPATRQPPRPVIEPAISAPENAKAISYEIAQASKTFLNGDATEANKRLKRAGIAGSNASKRWFTDSRNGWAPNSPLTIALKGSNRPGIDTGAMRAAITYVTKVDS